MLRTVFEAVATAWRAASLHERGLVPTISRMMMTPIGPPLLSSLDLTGGPSLAVESTRPAPMPASRDGSLRALAARRSSDRGRRLDRPRADLVEAGAAVHRPIIPWRERHHSLTTTAAADRRVELAGTADGPGPLRHSPARWAPLGVVQEPFAREEGLFATRKHKLTCAVAAGEGSILEHVGPVLLVPPDRPGSRGPPRRTGRRIGAGQEGKHRGSTGTGPELMSRRITSASSGIRAR